MAFDPTQPGDFGEIDAAQLRSQFNALKAEVDAVPAGPPGPPGEVSAEDLVAERIHHAVNPTGVSVLGLSVSDPPTQSEMQALASKVDELIAALRREP